VALQNAQLFDQTARQARRERLVAEITNKIRAADDMDGMLRTAVTELRQALGVRRAAVRLELPGSTPAAQQRRGTGPLPPKPLPDGTGDGTFAGDSASGRNGAHRSNGAGSEGGIPSSGGSPA
jgi:hypothetical protein